MTLLRFGEIVYATVFGVVLLALAIGSFLLAVAVLLLAVGA